MLKYFDWNWLGQKVSQVLFGGYMLQFDKFAFKFLSDKMSINFHVFRFIKVNWILYHIDCWDIVTEHLDRIDTLMSKIC